MDNLRIFLLLALFFAVLVECSSENPEAPAEATVHTQAWIDPNYAASTQYHGHEAATNGVESCRLCHGSDLKGANQIPGCDDCHFDPDGGKVPPGTNWTHGTTPHADFSAFQDVCNNCHAIMRRFNFAPAACHNCHGPGLTHVTGQPWLDSASTDFHGNSTLTCTACHNLNSWCFQCHYGPSGSRIPPGASWTHGTVPHNSFIGYEGACTACHTLTRSFRNVPPSCHDCHGASAHVTGSAWLNKTSPDFHGSSTLNCAGCHDLATRCTQCHFGTAGSKVPAGETWTHGTIPHDFLVQYIDVCNQCHALNRTYGNPPAACHDCHRDQTHVLGEPWLNKTSPDFHGNSTLTCSSCHDLNTKCTICHFDAAGGRSPAGSGWVHGANPDHRNYAAYQDVCNQCHSLNRTYGHGPIICHNCHIPWTHPFNWAVPRDSHQSFLGNNGKDATSCAGIICHGDSTLTGVTNFGPSCYTCHGKKWNLP